MTWQIAVKPQGENPGKEEGRNDGGMIVYLLGPNGLREEVKRVAFVRENSNRPDMPFDEALADTMRTARAAVDTVNELLSEQGQLV